MDGNKVHDTVDTGRFDAATDALRVALAYPANPERADDARLAAMEVALRALRIAEELARTR